MEASDPRNLLEFPCHYQFKAMGLAGEEFKQAIVETIANHVTVTADAVKSRPSGKGTYQAVSVMVTLYNYEQLTAIYADINLVAGLKMLI